MRIVAERRSCRCATGRRVAGPGSHGVQRPLATAAHSGIREPARLQTLRPHPVAAAVERRHLHYGPSAVDVDEPRPVGGILLQVVARRRRQAVERAPHVRRRHARPDAPLRRRDQHAGRRTRSTTPAPSSSSTSHDAGCAADSSTNAAPPSPPVRGRAGSRRTWVRSSTS